MKQVNNISIQKARNFIDLKGQRFNRLLVLERADFKRNKVGNSIVYWKCICDCGNIVEIRSRQLVTDRTKSCGCVQKEHITKLGSSMRLAPGVAAINNLFGRYKRTAKYKNLKFKLTKEEFKDLISKNCYYCGGEFKSKWTRNNEVKYNSDFFYNGIDRVDNKKGYIIKNVVTCCITCNTAKMDSTQIEFFNMIRKIYERHLS